MNFDVRLLLVVFAVWVALALLYATVPMLHMPGYALVWGVGALVFLALAGLLASAPQMPRKSHWER